MVHKDEGTVSLKTSDEPDRSEFLRGYQDAVNYRPQEPTSHEYLRGYARGLIGREIIEEEEARSGRCVVKI